MTDLGYVIRVAMVCVTLLVGLVLVLRYLKALHLTKTQAEALEKNLGAMYDSQQALIADQARLLLDLSAKLSAIGNRSR